MLTKLTDYFDRKHPNKKGQRNYTFRVTFSPDNNNDPIWSNVILNMEQISFQRSTTGSFARNIRRMECERNSLDFLYRNSDAFVKVWHYQSISSLSLQSFIVNVNK